MNVPSRLKGCQKAFLSTCLQSGIRLDGRELAEARDIKFQFSFCKRGHAEVSIGQTKALCFVVGEVVKPPPHRASEGVVNFNIDLSPIADRSYELHPGPGSETYKQAAQLSVLLDSILKRSRAVDTEALCIQGGAKVWSLNVEVRVIDDDGNIKDVVALAALAGLLHFRRDKELEIREYASKEGSRLPPTPLSIHHLPVLVTLGLFESNEIMILDPTKEEETFSIGQISIAVNQHQELCGIQKSGGRPMKSEMLHHAIRIASARGSSIIEGLLKALKDHDDQRHLSRKNIWERYEGSEPLEFLDEDSNAKSIKEVRPQKKNKSPERPFTLSSLSKKEVLKCGESVEALRARLKKRRQRLIKTETKKLAKLVDEMKEAVAVVLPSSSALDSKEVKIELKTVESRVLQKACEDSSIGETVQSEAAHDSSVVQSLNFESITEKVSNKSQSLDSMDNLDFSSAVVGKSRKRKAKQQSTR